MLLALLAVPFLVAQALSPRRAILRIEPAAVVLLVCAVGLQLIAAVQPDIAYAAVPTSFLLGTLALTHVAWESSKRRLPAALAALGGTMNLIPITIYGAMPVVRSSREHVSATPIEEPELLSAKHVELDLQLWPNPVSLLADWMPLPWINAVISPGDILLFGAFLVLGVHAARTTSPELQMAPNAANSATDGSSLITAA